MKFDRILDGYRSYFIQQLIIGCGLLLRQSTSQSICPSPVWTTTTNNVLINNTYVTVPADGGRYICRFLKNGGSMIPGYYSPLHGKCYVSDPFTLVQGSNALQEVLALPTAGGEEYAWVDVTFGNQTIPDCAVAADGSPFTALNISTAIFIGTHVNGTSYAGGYKHGYSLTDSAGYVSGYPFDSNSGQYYKTGVKLLVFRYVPSTSSTSIPTTPTPTATAVTTTAAIFTSALAATTSAPPRIPAGVASFRCNQGVSPTGNQLEAAIPVWSQVQCAALCNRKEGCNSFHLLAATSAGSPHSCELRDGLQVGPAVASEDPVCIRQ